MVDFAGWLMPVQYTSIVAEHQATRTAAGLFDISHMGRLRFDGIAGQALLDRLVTRDVTRLRPAQVGYALMTREDGGILDDVLVYHLADAAGTPYHLLVVNAGNRTKICDWIRTHAGDAAHHWADLSQDWAMLAVQGPRALELVQPFCDLSLRALRYYTAAETRLAGRGAIVSRTGYTGEDGCELIIGSAVATDVWQRLLAAGATPCGLGARDTLRLEAGMPLYGHELSEQIHPFEAGLAFAVHLDKAPFLGQATLAQLAHESPTRRRIGLRLAGRRVPREEYPVLAGNQPVGSVTSGTFSPTFDTPLAMAYVDPAHASPGTPLRVDIRGRAEPAEVVPLPFYRRPR